MIRYDVDGHDPLLRLSALAYKKVQSGMCIVCRKDAVEIANLTDSQVERLNKVIEKSKNLTMFGCLQDINEKIPNKTEARLSIQTREQAAEIEKRIDQLCESKANEWIEEFGLAHGWDKTDELKEVTDCWREFTHAWFSFRDEAKDISGVLGWKT